jgi:hypothetical protein
MVCIHRDIPIAFAFGADISSHSNWRFGLLMDLRGCGPIANSQPSMSAIFLGSYREPYYRGGGFECGDGTRRLRVVNGLERPPSAPLVPTDREIEPYSSRISNVRASGHPEPTICSIAEPHAIHLFRAWALARGIGIGTIGSAAGAGIGCRVPWCRSQPGIDRRPTGEASGVRSVECSGAAITHWLADI